MHEDFDSHMTVQFLEQLAKDALALSQMIDPNKNLEDWIDFKVGRARQDIADIKSYIEYQTTRPRDFNAISAKLEEKGYLKASKILKEKK